MGWLNRVSHAIDRLNGAIGRGAAWLVVAMALLGAGNAVARYLGRYLGASLGSNAFLEAQWYLFGVVLLFAAPWTLQQDQHVRVDVLYGRLTTRGKAAIDLAGTLLFLLPFAVFVVWTSVPAARASWATWEVSPDPGGLPRYPIKTAVPVAFVLLALQGVSEAIKRVQALREGSP